MKTLVQNPVFRFLSDLRLGAVLLVILAVTTGAATLIESHYAGLGSSQTGRAAAYDLVYDAPWFNALLIVLFVNVALNLVRRMQRGHYALGFLLVHVGILVILVGAGITRWFGFEGYLHIREGQANNVVSSADMYARVRLGETEAEMPVRLYRPGAQSLSRQVTLEGRTITLGVAEYWPRFERTVVPGEGGFAQVVVSVMEDGGLRQHTLREGDEHPLAGVPVRFHRDGMPPLETMDAPYGLLRVRAGGQVCRQLAATRHFNSLGIDDYFVRKRSSDHRKIDAEANWLRSVPSELQPFTARLIEDDQGKSPGEYCTLYSSYPTVAELYLAQSSRLVWRRVLDSCLDFLDRAYRHTALDRVSPFKWLVIDKLHERLQEYPGFLPSMREPLRINGEDVGSLESNLDHLEAVVSMAPELPSCVMHGDFCFSNILFDLRADRIVLIDPRGLVGDETTLYGDVRYDIAKLGHSILGRYDQIMGEHLVAEQPGNASFELQVPNDPLRDWLEAQFLASQIAEVPFNAATIQAAIVSLFLSMIPLHQESQSRQATLFANALRLYERNFHSGDQS